MTDTRLLFCHPQAKPHLCALLRRMHDYGMLEYFDMEEIFIGIRVLPKPFIIFFPAESMDWGVFDSFMKKLVENETDPLPYPDEVRVLDVEKL